MAVLLVTHYYAEHRGGVERIAEEVAGRLARRGISVEWAASAPCDRPLPDGVSPLPAGASPRLPLLRQFCRLSLRATIPKAGGGDAAHRHGSLFQPAVAGTH